MSEELANQVLDRKYGFYLNLVAAETAHLPLRWAVVSRPPSTTRPRHVHDTSTSGAHRLVPPLGHTGVPRRRPQAARRGAPLSRSDGGHALPVVLRARTGVPCRRSSRSGHRGRKSTCTTTRPSPASPSPTSTTRSAAGFTRTPAPECPSRRHTRAARGAALEGMGGRAAGRGAD